MVDKYDICIHKRIQYCHDVEIHQNNMSTIFTCVYFCCVVRWHTKQKENNFDDDNDDNDDDDVDDGIQKVLKHSETHAPERKTEEIDEKEKTETIRT